MFLFWTVFFSFSTWCDQGGAPPARYQEALTDDSRAILADYINDYYGELEGQTDGNAGSEDVVDVEGFPDVIPESPVQKKDEFVDIHKYWADKRNDERDRPEFRDIDDTDYGSPAQDEAGLDDNLNFLVDELRPNDLLLLKSYLQNMGQEEEEEEEENAAEEDFGEGPTYGEAPIPVSNDDMVNDLDKRPNDDDLGYVWRDREAFTEDDMTQPGEELS